MATTLRLILGDQLNHNHSWFTTVDDSVVYVMMEIRPESEYVRHHIQKQLAFFTAMRRFANWLRTRGHRVDYLTITDHRNQHSFLANCQMLVESLGATRFDFIEPDEYRLDQQLADVVAELGLDAAMVDSEHFLTSRTDLGDFFAGKKTYLMESFYRMMRRRHDVLMDGDGPRGGKWNLDTENRKPLPKNHQLPDRPGFANDVRDILIDIETAGLLSFGRVDATALRWPLDRRQALQALQQFVDIALPDFGRYQDAMTSSGSFLYHSLLSFALNVKLLHPREVIDAVVAAGDAHSRDIPFSAVEGFVRQILGWREYMRGIYWSTMPDYADQNYFGHTNRLPSWYWTGDTKMACLRHAITQSLDDAYAHHIQRLMITGNFALLAGIDPDEVGSWYLGIYIDAIEWVEITNTRGMSQFADGGLVATKPYVSSANYINKMSDYCMSCHYSRTLRTGEQACPFNSLYWDFFDRQRHLLGTNHRLSMVYRTLDKLSATDRDAIRRHAKSIRKNLDLL